MTSSPTDYPLLDIVREQSNLSRALDDLKARALLEVRWLEGATLDTLREALLSDTFHIFHFIGHGGFDARANDGMLVFEDASRRGRVVSAERLAILLGNHPTLRLVILNACEGARTSVQDPFAGAAMTFVRSAGIPAVLAMQFEITDTASIAFSRGFYGAIAAEKPVDAAVTQGRLAIFAEDNDVEWGTPVLYLRAPDGVIFAPMPPEEIARLERERAEQERLAREKAAAERLARERAEAERAAKIAELYRAAEQSLQQKEFPAAISRLEELLALDSTHAGARALILQAHRLHLEARIAAAKARRVCWNCSRPLRSDQSFCGNCGMPSNAAQIKLCPRGHPNRGNRRFCAECGDALSGTGG
jgi:CHAT domain-containing protein